MLRLTEIKLPLDHSEAELRAAVLAHLGIADAELLSLHVHRRGYDARRRGDALKPAWQTLRWDLEELRVSLFAQELRTPQPVSVKRIDKAWSQLTH